MRHAKRIPTHPVRRLADALQAVAAAQTDRERQDAERALARLRRELGLRTGTPAGGPS